MISKALEKLPCLLWCKEYDSHCEGTKPYRTGTPFCGYHLREVFGLDADYSEPQLMTDNTVHTHGPFLTTSPDITHTIGTIIIPRRNIVESIYTSNVIPHNINGQFLKYLQNLRADQRMSGDYKRYIMEMLKNFTEMDVSVSECNTSIKHVIEKNIKEWTDALSKNTKDIAKAIEIYSISENNEQTKLPLSDLMPPLMQHVAIHIIPSIVQNPSRNMVTYLPHTTQSNILYTGQGFVCESTLSHKEILVQAGEATTNVFEYLKHVRPTTTSDRNEVTIRSLAERAAKAFPKPLETWNSLLSGQENIDCCSKR